MTEQPSRPKVSDVVARADRAEITHELGGLLDRLGDGTGEITVWVAALYIAVLQKMATDDVERSVGKLTESSIRLEGFTKSVVSLTRWLIFLTIALLVVATPPAVETIAQWFHKPESVPGSLPSMNTAGSVPPPTATVKPKATNPDADIDPLGLFSHEENTKHRQEQKAKQKKQ